MITEYGFDYGPMKVERAWGDSRVGYGIQIKVGKRIFSIETSPAGRTVKISEHEGGNVWRPLA